MYTWNNKKKLLKYELLYTEHARDIRELEAIKKKININMFWSSNSIKKLCLVNSCISFKYFLLLLFLTITITLVRMKKPLKKKMDIKYFCFYRCSKQNNMFQLKCIYLLFNVDMDGVSPKRYLIISHIWKNTFNVMQ